MERRDHPRQRPAGRLHPAPLGDRDRRGAAGADGLCRRGPAGRDRLHVPARAAQRVSPPADGAQGDHRGHPGARGSPRPGLRQSDQADRLVPGRGHRSAARRRARLDRARRRRARLAAGRALAPAAGDRRERRDRAPGAGGLRGGRLRRRRHPGGRGRGRRPAGRRGGDRQGLWRRACWRASSRPSCS